MHASSTAVRSMRVWKHARYALHYDIRSDEMTLVMLMASPQKEEGSCQGHVVCSYNTTVETSI
jgi:hypothetical protein